MRYTLPIIVVSQFFCTSLWFAGNSIISDIVKDLKVDQNFLTNMTSAIQFGFIIGTLVFAIFYISDRFSPSKVFFFSAVFAGLFNIGITLENSTESGILLCRFFTGFFLAGIYPVGMKIASDYYKEGLGKSLGFLIGALVIGTAFPHLLKEFTIGLPWQFVLYTTTILSVLGGITILLFVPDGPYRQTGRKIKRSSFVDGFRNKEFRSACFGYFGHMWELYTFWAFIPIILASYNHQYPSANLNIPLFSFLLIGSGAIACVFSGLLSQRYGAKKIATISLFLSCLCCLISPLFLFSNSAIILLLFLLFWGLFVIADSPLFSTLIAKNAPTEARGTFLTIVNCIGYSITIISLQFVNFFSDKINPQYLYILLAIGPILGLFSLLNKTNSEVSSTS